MQKRATMKGGNIRGKGLTNSEFHRMKSKKDTLSVTARTNGTHQGKNSLCTLLVPSNLAVCPTEHVSMDKC